MTAPYGRGSLEPILFVFLRYLKMAQGIGVVGDALVQRFGDLLTMLGFSQHGFVAGVGEEADFSEHAGHGCADQHDEGRFLNIRVSPDDAGRPNARVENLADFVFGVTLLREPRERLGAGAEGFLARLRLPE